MKHLLAAQELYQSDTKVLGDEEQGRVCMALCSVYRHLGNNVESKRYLELARDKTKDNAQLLKFYQESAKIFNLDKKFYQALDSNKKALEIAKQLYRDDDYGIFECQINLAESYEKTGDHEMAQQTFDECFNALDGRDEKSNRTMSIRSGVSRAMSIRSKNTSIVMYRK